MADAEEKLPWFQMFVADYLRDTRHLSLAARGAWIDILCAMHVSAERGVVVFNRLKLARFLGCTVEHIADILDELRDPSNATGSPVCQYEEFVDGSFKLTSRRMVRDEKRRKINKENGNKGGNPKLKPTRITDSDNRTSNPPVNPGVNPRVRVRDRAGDESPDPSFQPAASLPSAAVGNNDTGQAVDEKPAQGRPADPPPSERKQRPPTDSGPRETTDGLQRRPRGERKLTEEQNGVRVAFIAWWCDEAYPMHMGGTVYPFNAEGARNGQAVTKILKAAEYDIDVAKSIALVYLRTDDAYISRRNRPLYGIAEQLTTWVSQANGARANPSGASYGSNRNSPRFSEPQQPNRQLPNLRPASASGPVPRAG